MPVTCAEVLVRLRQPPTVYSTSGLAQNHMRFRVSPETAIALGLSVIAPGQEVAGQAVEMMPSRHPGGDEMDAYEKLLGDAMAGDATLFAREDYVEEAWRIVDPVMKANTKVYEYEPGTWGPAEVDQQVVPGGGWHTPVLQSQLSPGEIVQAA
jgi:glucose-6-phosphate 1-dehydrogenase